MPDNNYRTPVGYGLRTSPYAASLTCYRCGAVVDYSYTATQDHDRFHEEIARIAQNSQNQQR